MSNKVFTPFSSNLNLNQKRIFQTKRKLIKLFRINSPLKQKKNIFQIQNKLGSSNKFTEIKME